MTQEALKLALEGVEIHSPNSPEYIVCAALIEALREHAMREVQRLGQEPVVGITAIRTWFKDGRVVTQTLCNSWVDTTPPQSTWVGLTDEEIKKISKKHKWHESNVEPHLMPVFRSLEAKLKEKNT